MSKMTLTEERKKRREDSLNYINKDLEVEREIVFGCDDCGAVNVCPYAFDPYNMDDDCLEEK